MKSLKIVVKPFTKKFSELALSCVYFVFVSYVWGVLQCKVLLLVSVSFNLFAFLNSQVKSQDSCSWIHLHGINPARAPAPFTQ